MPRGRQVNLPSFPQLFDEIGTGPGDPGADRAHRAVADLGRLHIGKPQHLGEHERQPALGVEAGEEGLDRDGPGGVGLVGGPFEAGRQAPPAAQVTDRVGAGSAGDRQQPGTGAGVTPEGRQGPVGPQVDLLGDVVGQVPADQLRAEAPDLTLAPLDPGGEGELVAVLGGEEKLGQFVDAGTSGVNFSNLGNFRS